jgi:tape measure domain-containing protein
MASNLENVGYNLILDDSGFRVTAQSTAAQLKALEAQFASTGQGVKAIEQKINSAGVAFHQWVTTIGAVKFALMDIDSVFLTLPRSIMETAGELEKLTTVLKGLSTAADEAGRNADAALGKKFILNLEQNAPFKLAALTDTFVKFKTVGIDPTKGAMEALINQVAKYGGGSEQLKSASLAIQQMAGKGVVSLQELRLQLSQAIPNAAQAMADGMGMSMGELTKKISTGTVSSEMAIRKMLAVFTLDSLGSAAEQMKTWQGEIEKLNVRWELFKNDVAEAGMFDAAKKELEDIMGLFGTETAKNWSKDLSNSFVSMIGLFHDGREVLQEYIPQLLTISKLVLAAFATNMLSNFLTGMRNAVVGMNASWREYAANAITAQGAVAAKQLSVTEQILAADAKRMASIAQESELRQEALAREIANNQKLMLIYDAADARRDAARQAEYAKEIANNEKRLAANMAFLAQLKAEHAAYEAALVPLQFNSMKLGQANSPATAAEYVAAQKQTDAMQRNVQLTAAQIDVVTRDTAALMEKTAALKGVAAAELANAEATGRNSAMLVAHNAELATGIRAEREMVNNMTAMTRGAAMMESGLLKLKFVFNALGGWIGLVSIAVVAGIGFWQKYRQAAKDAAQAALDAANVKNIIAKGEADKDAVARQNTALTNNQAELGLVETQIQNRKNGIGDDGTTMIPRAGENDPEVKALRAKAAALRSAGEDIKRVRDQLQAQVDDKSAELASHSYANQYETETNKQLSGLTAAKSREIATLQTNFAKTTATMDKQSKEYTALANQLATDKNKVEQKISTDYIAALNKRQAELADAIVNNKFTGKGKELEAQKLAAAREQERIAQQLSNAQSGLQALAAPNEYVAGKDKKTAAAKPPTDLFAKKNADIKSQLAQATNELKMIVSGASEYDQIRVGAEAKIRAIWENGELDTKGHGKGAKNSRPAWDSAEVRGLIDDETMLKITENAKSQMESLKGKLAPLAAEYQESIKKLMAGDVSTPDSDESNGRGAIKFLEKLGTKSTEAAKKIAPVVEYMKSVQLQADQVDMVKFTREIVKTDQDTQAQLIENTRDRITAQIALDNDRWEKAAKARLERAKADGGDISNEEAMIDAARVTRAAEQAKRLRTPMEQLAIDWQDTTDQMAKKSTEWSNSTIDAFVNVAKTGKLNFGSLFESIATDMLKISLQKSMGGGLQQLYDGIGQKFTNIIGSNSKASGGEAATGAATGSMGSGIMSFLQHPIDGVTSLFNKLTGSGDTLNSKMVEQARQAVIGVSADTTTANSVITLGNAALYAAQALASMGGGGGGGIGGALASIAGAAASAYFGGAGATATSTALAGTQSFGSGLSGETNMSTLMGVQGGTNTLGNYTYQGGAMSNQYKFADGGIMTEMGPLALRKYANGGIANSPQVAVYGEGSMNEAFVPLPDGRSIPVTITGGQQGGGTAPAVTVNVINQTSQPVTAQQGSPRFDGRQMVLDIVLTAATTPGSFRDGMKGALK